MTVRKSGLGRNLNALLGDNIAAVRKIENDAPSDKQLRMLPIEKLMPGIYQPRREMEPTALQELADSIKAQGIIQPIVVREKSQNQFEIIAGERRWRAAQLAELHEVPVIVKNIGDEATMAMALIENIQREDLNPIEEARALTRLLQEFALTHEEVARAVGKSRTTVTNLMRLMNLQEDVKKLLETRKIEMGHARALLSLEGSQQNQVAQQIVAKGLTVRETERLVKQYLTTKSSIKSVKPALQADTVLLQRELSESLCAPVTIDHQSSGKGKLVIHYHSLDGLEGIIQKLKGNLRF